jgi:cellulose synthase operon protein YhjQ
MAGGVGRTSLLATVGRALSSSGERVVLGDAARYSLLPFFFGGNELRPGEMRRFAPAEDSGDSPVFLVNYDLARAGSDLNQQKHFVGEILRGAAECHRILLDLPMGSEWLLRRLATLQATVLVPLLPDLSSMVSIEAVERYFERFADEDGSPVLPFYVLNQFDASQKLHLDVRDLLRARLGERLLNFVVRRSTAVSEALAEGMTVADYAPESAVARDFSELAVWLRTVSPPVVSGMPTPGIGRG